MKRLRDLTFPFIVLSSLLQGCSGMQQTPHMASCGKIPKLELVSLAMFPDPLPEARKIDQWRAIIRSDSSDLCQTTLGIVEADSDKWVTPEQPPELSLGANEVTFYSVDDYRLA